MGNNFGRAHDAEMQCDIVRQALAMIYSVEEGGALVDYETKWSDAFQYAPGGQVIARAG